MEITFTQCQRILETLPIGYYAKRRIEASLDETVDTSFYSPIEDKIVVSFPIIYERVTKLTNEADKEEAVRSMLYHEVSHAILTPELLKSNAVINIFEDERIETILQDYYHNVNFKKQLYDIHDGKIPTPSDDLGLFFNVVRFGVGPSEIQDEIEYLIQKHSKLNRCSSFDEMLSYRDDIWKLFEKIRKHNRKNPDDFNMPMNTSSDENNDKKGDKKQTTMTSEGNPEETPKEMNRKISVEKKDIEATMKQGLEEKYPEMSEKNKQQLVEFQKVVEMIIGNFNKKNNGGSGINTYSGVFNPRAVVRQDYRFFERSINSHGNNKFGSCHLNLIIDCSGSFCYNEQITNGIISALTEVERKNHNFTVDIAFINEDFNICKSIRERILHTGGGNRIPKDMKEILLSMQKPQTLNYNIILFDGDAMSDQCFTPSEHIRRFGAFDMKQTTLITDPENNKYINNSFHSAKVVITHEYAKELIRHIINALTIAFA